MKKFISLLLVSIILTMIFTSCQNDNESQCENNDTSSTETQPTTSTYDFSDCAADDLYLVEHHGIFLVNKATKEIMTVYKGDHCFSYLDGTDLFYLIYKTVEGFDNQPFDVYKLDVKTNKTEKLYSGDGTEINLIYGKNNEFAYTTGSGFVVVKDGKDTFVDLSQHEIKQIFYNEGKIYYSYYNDTFNDDVTSYNYIFSYDISSGNTIKIAEDADTIETDIKAYDGKIYYVTNRLKDSQTASDYEYGVYRIVRCNPDGSGKELLGEYMSTIKALSRWNNEFALYSYRYHNDDEGNRVWREFFMSIYSGKQFSLGQYVGDTEFWTAQDSDGKMYLVYKKDGLCYLNTLNNDGTLNEIGKADMPNFDLSYGNFDCFDNCICYMTNEEDANNRKLSIVEFDKK